MTVWVKTLWIVGRAAPQFRHRFYGSVKGTNNWYRPANLFESPVSMSAHDQINQLEDADRCEKYDCGEKCHWLMFARPKTKFNRASTLNDTTFMALQMGRASAGRCRKHFDEERGGHYPGLSTAASHDDA